MKAAVYRKFAAPLAVEEVERYKRGRLKLDEVITARYPLEEIDEAIASANRGEALRNVIVCP